MSTNGVRTKLIVTADDFGLSEKVNEGILEAFHKGVVRNTTLMVNYPDAEASVACLKQAKGLDVGIHLNLTSGPPVLSPGQVPSLVDRRGKFFGLGPFLTRAVLGRIDWSDVRNEWRAQIERGIHMGCHFSSITGHQHIHMLPPLAKISASLVKEYGITAVRLSRFHSRNIFWPLFAKALVLNPCAAVARRLFDREKIRYNHYVIEIPSAPINMALERFRRNLQRIPEGVHELVCHPGYVDRTLEDRDAYTSERLFELEIVTAPQIRKILGEQTIQLTTYRRFTSSDECSGGIEQDRLNVHPFG
jgi:chitin disaccharide deacetylase